MLVSQLKDKTKINKSGYLKCEKSITCVRSRDGDAIYWLDGVRFQLTTPSCPVSWCFQVE